MATTTTTTSSLDETKVLKDKEQSINSVELKERVSGMIYTQQFLCESEV